MRLLSSSRMTDSIELANFFNINTYNHKFTPVETSTLKIIQEAFNGEPMVTQYQVGSYRIDLYLSAHKLAIECDERNHIDRDPEYEINRESIIRNELHCEFIRYNPNASNFNIISVINQIYKKIISKITK
jgi:very-short-patch-repair endonuclease